MKVISRIPFNIDYLLGALCILTGIYTTYHYGRIIVNLPDYAYIFIDTILPSLCMVIGGFILLILPHKNTWRTIWLCALIMGINLILTANSDYATYEVLRRLGSILEQSFSQEFEMFTFAVLYLGCGIAMIVNAVLFALERTKSIYTMIICIILTLILDYLGIRLQFYLYNEILSLDFVLDIVETFVPHMLLFGVFMVVFTSGEVSWYTAKRNMWIAINRLRTVGSIFAIHSIYRNQLIRLLQSREEYSMRLHQGRFHCTLEVRNRGDRMTLVFCRSGTDSLASAVYVNVQKILLPDSLSKSRYVDIFGEEGEHIRLNITEPPKHLLFKKIRKAQMANGILPWFRYSVTNASLYHIVDGTGSVQLGKGKKPEDIFRLEVTGSGDERRAIVYRANGEIFSDMPALAIVPAIDYGAYRRLYIYGNFGEYMAFRVKLPKRNQEEKPDKIEG